MATKPANNNPLARTRANLDQEVERLPRKHAGLEDALVRLETRKARLERENAELRTRNGSLERRLTRRRRTIGALLSTAEIKAAYCMFLASWGEAAWWANALQAITGLAIGGYLIWPNARTLGRHLLRLSRDTTDLPDDKRGAH
jgi:hypothetical protein